MQNYKHYVVLLFLSIISLQSYAFSRGIYLTEPTVQDARKVTYFIGNAKKLGIDTFVIDAFYTNRSYAQNVKRIAESGIHVVARVVIFPHGGSDAQVNDRRLWAKRLAMMKYAVGLGANEVQLDYIRYNVRSYSSPKKSQRIAEVVKYFKDALSVPIQIDIFGVAAHRPSHTIGQDVSALAPYVDAICPMVYPSHYEPFRHHATRPYSTVLDSVLALKGQLKNYPNIRVYPYIELYNYRYPLSTDSKLKYIAAQLKAARDSGANGWYAWSPNNKYWLLFKTLQHQ